MKKKLMQKQIQRRSLPVAKPSCALSSENLSSNKLNRKPFLIKRRLNYTPPNFILLLLRYSELLFLLVLLGTIGV